MASGGDDDGTPTLKVGVNPVPHGDILAFVRDELAADAGLKIDIVEIPDYNTPNTQLVEGELDANYFQHREFLKEWQDANPDNELSYVTDVHIERLGLYSKKHDKVGDLGEGAEIAVPNDPANLNRALRTLEKEGLVEIDPDAGENASEKSITENPKDLKITPLEAPQIPRSIDDVDAAVVNGNFAIEADLSENSEVLAWEPQGGDYAEKYANGLVVPADQADGKQVRTLVELLHKPEVAEYIDKTWKGVVLPVDAEGAIEE
nr:MetQ/NlpA family ABC transporter substrate-binding protein [Murinocardiopsis flavida]